MAAVILAMGAAATSLGTGGASTNDFGNTFFVTGTNQLNSTFRTAGVTSKLSTYISASTTNGNTLFRLMKNNANGNLLITIGAAATGLFEDTSNTDSNSAGDTLHIKQDANASSSGSYTPRTLSALFAATTDSMTKLMSTPVKSWLSSGTFFMSLAGQQDGSLAAEASAQQYMGVAGTLTKLGVRIASNSSPGAETVTSRKNGAAGNLLATITALTTGTYEDTSNSDTIAAADLCNYSPVFLGSVNLDVAQLWTEFISTSSEGLILVGKPSGGTTLSTYPRYCGIGGAISTLDSTENNVRTKANASFTAKKLSCYFSANTNSTTYTLTLRVAAADTALTATIPNATTGSFTDTTHTVSINSGDILTYGFNSSGSPTGTSSLRTISMSATYSGAGPTTALKDIIGQRVIPRKR